MAERIWLQHRKDRAAEREVERAAQRDAERAEQEIAGAGRSSL
ncbi:hypothetical protein [Streptomyces sp. ICC4]|nr:hypothetical protein [Streptomyces sp. ICC4]